MTGHELGVFLAIRETEVDWRGDELVAWLHPLDLGGFVELFKGFNFPFDAALCFDGSIAVDLVPFCEWYDIDPETIKSKL